ncbi:hypothetical protein PVAND_007192 [Polypedilum vanderplanki]|uniref:Mitochondrial 28S ribosomal protein S27 n=1 Tax=Polypedilum vanderplanki TaxID=319348 RepID=A0A9J6C5Y1_POLVA|nr:hypothetical protein PVAND_007192 [Polypedilum vanderplanki]
MWKNLRINYFRDFSSLSRRTYFSEAYKLNTEWEQRLSTPILQKINNENLFVDLNSKFQQKKKINAIDVDIYTNKADSKHIEEALDLVQKLRTTAQASKIFDSTQHAVIRLLLSNADLLISILNNRLDFGIIPDNYTINLVLDEYLKNKNYVIAARLATLQMLQEDFEHPVTRYMCLFACYKFLDELQTFPDLLPAPLSEETETTTPTPKSKKKPDEIKVRVAYLRNPYFDDHFDITNSNHLVGKTFLYLADEVKSVDEILANSLNLLGYALYEKFENGNKFLEKESKSNFYKEIVDRVKVFAEKTENIDEHGQKFYDNLNNIVSQKEANVSDLIEGHLKQAVIENESKDIEAQKKVFEDWIMTRQTRLDEELARMKRIQRLEEIEKIQEEMKKTEKKLWFFENYENIKLEIQSKKRFYPKTWWGKKSKPKKLDENYIPPDVESITRSRKAQ